MIKNIVIIGGGISGLATLHYLRKKYASHPEIQILLLEKNEEVGGTIGTVNLDGSLIERGPNGFLDNQQNTLEFLSELNLMDQLITARAESKIRYLRQNNTLHPFPKQPFELFSFKPLSLSDKISILMEIFRPKGGNAQETVYAFACRRFGKRCAEVFFDCVVSGIYGGDIYQLNMREAFPAIVELETHYGSVIKGLISTAGNKKKAQMRSLREGMGQLMRTLGRKYAPYIQTSADIQSIQFEQGRFVLNINGVRKAADELFLSTPAFAAAVLVEDFAPVLAQHLARIQYAPMAVVGLVYRKSDFKQVPAGFGYLIPSEEGRMVLGVLLESNVYEGRAEDGLIAVRVMLGGVRHADKILNAGPELYAVAHQAVADVWPIDRPAVQMSLIHWPQAIPQYTQEYARLKPRIEAELKQFPRLHITANYWKGVSFNECIKNARLAVEQL